MAKPSAAPTLPLNNGRAMPAVGFGTWRCDTEKLGDAVLHALRIGYRHFDCAGIYRNEHIIGKAIATAIAEGVCTREDLFLTSKLAMTQMSPSAVLPAIQKSIAELGVNYLDLYLTHWPYALDPACTTSPPPFNQRLGYSPEAYLAVWREMEAAVDAGLVRSLGCSNMTAAKLHALCTDGAARIRPVNVQVELHPFLAQPALKAYCDRHGVILTGYHPLGSPGRPQQYRAEGDPDVMGSPIVTGVAAATGRSTAQVVLRWAVQRGTVPLPRSTTPSRVSENFDLFSWALSEEHMAALDGLDATAGSLGRIMKGDHLVQEGGDWRAVWDEGFDHTQ